MKRLFLLIIVLLTLAKSTAQDLWQQNAGFTGSLPASSLAINSDGHIFVGGFDGSIYRSTDKGSNWRRLAGSRLGQSMFRNIAIDSKDHLYASTTKGILFRSVDHGDSWTQIKNISTQTNTSVSSFIIHSKGQLLVGAANKILSSNRNGDMWTEISNDAIKSNSEVSAMVITSTGGLVVGTSHGRVCLANLDHSWIQADVTSSAIRSFATKSEGHIFAASSNDGVFRSTDQGETWIAINNGLTNTHVQSLSCHTNGNLFAGTTDGGIFRSSDNGSSWTQVATIFGAYGVWSFALHPDGEIFAATDAGVYYSHPDGQNWTQTGLTDAQVRSLASNSNGYLYAATFGAGVFRSTNNGDSWTPINSGLESLNVLAISVNSKGEVFAGTLFGGLYRSSDSGASWIRKPISLIRPVTYETVSAIAASGNDLLYAGTQNFLGLSVIHGVYSSPNDGQNWEKSAFLSDVNSLAIDDSGYVYAGSLRGVFRTTDSDPDSTWAPYWWRESSFWFGPVPEVMPGDVMDLAIDDDDQIFAATFDRGMFRLTDTTWTQINTGIIDTVALSVTITQMGDIFAGTFSGNIFSSASNGNNWVLSNPGMVDTAVPSLVSSPSGHIFAGTNGDGVFRNLHEPPAIPILASPADGDTVETEDVSLSWIPVIGLPYQIQLSVNPNFQTSVINISDFPGGSTLATRLLNETTYYWRVRATNTVGTSAWSAVYSFLTNIRPSTPILISPEGGATGVDTTVTFVWNAARRAATYELQYSTDSAFQATFSVTGLVETSFAVVSLQRDTTYHWRVNSTNAFGTSDWSNVSSFQTGMATSIDQVDDQTPKTYRLSQNYPNPFNPETVINYQLPKNSKVKLVIYNQLGQLVRTLIYESQTVGAYQISWKGLDDSGKPTSSGVYLYRLQAGSFTEIRKMLLIR